MKYGVYKYGFSIPCSILPDEWCMATSHHQISCYLYHAMPGDGIGIHCSRFQVGVNKSGFPNIHHHLSLGARMFLKQTEIKNISTHILHFANQLLQILATGLNSDPSHFKSHVLLPVKIERCSMQTYTDDPSISRLNTWAVAATTGKSCLPPWLGVVLVNLHLCWATAHMFFTALSGCVGNISMSKEFGFHPFPANVYAKVLMHFRSGNPLNHSDWRGCALCVCSLGAVRAANVEKCKNAWSSVLKEALGSGIASMCRCLFGLGCSCWTSHCSSKLSCGFSWVFPNMVAAKWFVLPASVLKRWIWFFQL